MSRSNKREIKKCCLKWFGHIYKRSKTTLPMINLRVIVSRNKEKRKTNKYLNDAVRKDMTECGVTKIKSSNKIE